MKFTSGTYMCFEMSGLFGCGMYCFLHSIVCCVCRKTNYVDILNSSSFLSPLSTLWLGYKQNIVQLKRSKTYIQIRHLLWQKSNRFSATYVWHSCAKLLNIFNIESLRITYILLYLWSLSIFLFSVTRKFKILISADERINEIEFHLAHVKISQRYSRILFPWLIYTEEDHVIWLIDKWIQS